MITMTDETNETPRAPLPKTAVLVTAATRWEAEPLAKGLGLSPAGDGRWEGLVSGHRVVLVKTGMGAIKTRERLENGFVAGDFGLVLSAGLCGATHADVKAGDLVFDAAEVEMDLVVPLRETARAASLRFHFGRILHTNIVLKPAAKRALGAEQRTVACDMETAAVRRWAGARAPVAAARVVLDELDEELPADAPEGEDAASLARFALAHASSVPRLVAVGLRSGRAMKTLTRFLKAYLEAL